MFAMNLALLANNIGLMWVAIELATLTTVLMVGIYRTPRGARGGLEILHPRQRRHRARAVRHHPGLYGGAAGHRRRPRRDGVDRRSSANAAAFDPALLNLAFVFLLLGYGTKVGLAPLHAWLPDAHAEGPTPISAVLSGLLLNVALYALLRFKMLLAGQPDGAGARTADDRRWGWSRCCSRAFMLYRRRDIKRLFAYSSIEHMGIITFAFGIGGPLANFAGLLHMTMHSLTKSAIFFAVGHIAQVKGTQKIADIGGLTETHPVLGWGLVLGVVAIAGLPPLGIFTSEFLAVSADLRAPAVARAAAGARPPGRLRRAVPAAQPHRLRRAHGRQPQGQMLLCADVRPSRPGARGRHLSAASRSSPGSRPSRSCSDRPTPWR